MFERYFSMLQNDKKIQLFVGVLGILYLTCVSDLLPGCIKETMEIPMVKVLMLAAIVVLSKYNFEVAILLTLVYFSTALCIGQIEVAKTQAEENK